MPRDATRGYARIDVTPALADFLDEEQDALGVDSWHAVILHHLRDARIRKRDRSRQRAHRARRRGESADV